MSNRDALAEMGQRLLSAEKEIRNLHGDLVREKGRLVLAEKVISAWRESTVSGGVTLATMQVMDKALEEYDKAIREGN